ncbi:YigZ family protein [Clostridiaceae bacterium UIB06]|uniref:YigZ family protein n=1 Tax=Clostridium thailandense TaxID=2794346 RepID=A0A949TZ76_9CLOT|nr:YigZ family protein [Clostridium thailandense]MBV7276371.1 YigZ family protein [Clostridium thailandense]MCH5135850.1 YigZ family protein [Clostridiaceae bacterium UIB06]
MGYFTIKDEASSQFEEKKSIFIGHIKRVYTEDEAKSFINKVKTDYRDARHNVYAYVIGQNMGIQRYSDDGEPQGTGGIPVLEVIKKNEITDVVIVVTRYFGGILLGKGGLVRAYSKGAAMAVNDGGIVEKVKGVVVDIILDYDMLGKVQYLFEQKLWYVESTDYTDKVRLMMYCPVDKLKDVESSIIEVTNGKCQVIVGDEEYYFKFDNRLFKES